MYYIISGRFLMLMISELMCTTIFFHFYLPVDTVTKLIKPGKMMWIEIEKQKVPFHYLICSL